MACERMAQDLDRAAEGLRMVAELEPFLLPLFVPTPFDRLDTEEQAVVARRIAEYLVRVAGRIRQDRHGTRPLLPGG